MILAIDPATTTGWACDGSSGVLDFKLRSNESKGMKFRRFRNEIERLILENKIEVLVYEKPGGRFFSGVRSHANFEGVLLEISEKYNLDYRDYSAGEIKRFAKTWMENETGAKIKGMLKKEDMVEAAILRFPNYKIIDDNHADALWLLELSKSEIS